MSKSYAAAVASGSQLIFHHEQILRRMRSKVAATGSIRKEIATLSYEIETTKTKLRSYESNANSTILQMMQMNTNATRDEQREKANMQDEIDRKTAKMKDLKAHLDKLELRIEESFYLAEAVPFLNRLSSAREHFHSFDNCADENVRKQGQVNAIAEIQQVTREFVEKFVEEPQKEHMDGMTPKIVHIVKVKPCLNCGCTEFNEHGQMEICKNCGGARRNQMLGALPSYDRLKDSKPSREFTYKRLTHFRNTLKQVCGISCKTVPEELKDQLKEELVKRRIPFMDLEPKMTRYLLKKLGYAIYYEETISITCEINPTYKPLYICPEHEEEMCFIFKVIEGPFEKVKHQVNENRQNFMSYPFTAIKICEHKAYVEEQEGNVKESLMWRAYMKNFDLLKGVERLIEHDKIWKLICKELRWYYFNTIGNVAMSVDFSKPENLDQDD